MARKRAPRATGLTATVEPDVLNVRLDVTVPAGHNTLTIGRKGPSGTETQVRGWHTAAVSPGAIVARDFEAPLGVPIVYTAVSWTAGQTNYQSATATVTIPDTGCDNSWLTDLARPTNTQQIVIESLPELAYSIPVGVHDVLARRTPIVSSDIANTPTFELSFLTDGLTGRDQARATLGNGLPVLLRTSPDVGIGNLYFGVTGFREQRIVTSGLEDDRRFAVSAVQVDRPDPGLYEPVPPRLYSEVKAEFATYAELKAERASYDALAYDYTGDTPGDVVPWPPTDV